MLELVFTSAKSGLLPGRSGFCSVAWTNGMPQNLISLLENMSGYNALYAPDDPRANQNPVCYSYQKIQLGKNQLRILSRIAFAGWDHTGRSNKIAHHIVLDEKEDKYEIMRMKHGPVSAFLEKSNFYTSWDSPPHLLQPRKLAVIEENSDIYASKWKEIAGDGRWAGYIADNFLRNRKAGSCIYLEYDNELHGSENILYMIREITRLMRPSEAQEFTFNTCFSTAQSGCDCFFRAALPSCTALPAIRKFKSSELISLLNTPVFPEMPVTANIARAQGKDVEDIPLMIQPPPPQAPGNPIQPPPQNQESVINLTEEMPTAEKAQLLPVKDGSSRKRLLIFSIIILDIFTVIAVAVFLILKFTASDNNKVPQAPETAKAPVVEKKQEQLVPTVLPVEKKLEVPVKPKPESKPKAEPKPESKPKAEPKPESKPKAPAVEKKKMTPFRIANKERYQIFRDITAGKTEITLPESCRGADGIAITLKNIWSNELGTIDEKDLKDCIRKNSNKEIIVYPVKVNKDDDYKLQPDKNNKAVMKITLAGNKLSIDDSRKSRDEHPSRKIITSIIIYKGKKEQSLNMEFLEDFIQFIPPGKYTGRLYYEKSEDEKIFDKYITSDSSRSATELSKDLDAWNVEVKKYIAADKIFSEKQKEYEKSFKDAAALESEYKKYVDAFKKYDGKKSNDNYIAAYDQLVSFVDVLGKASDKALKEFRDAQKIKAENVFLDKIIDEIEQVNEFYNRDFVKLRNAVKNLDSKRKEYRQSKDKNKPHEKDKPKKPVFPNKRLLGEKSLKEIEKLESEQKVEKLSLTEEEFAEILNKDIKKYIIRNMKNGENK